MPVGGILASGNGTPFGGTGNLAAFTETAGSPAAATSPDTHCDPLQIAAGAAPRGTRRPGCQALLRSGLLPLTHPATYMYPLGSGWEAHVDVKAPAGAGTDVEGGAVRCCDGRDDG